MSSIAISVVVFVCVFGGALFGMFLGGVLPKSHLDDASKDVVKLSMGLLATLTALVLGLLIASAKSSFDAQTADVTEISAKVVLLDRVLADYEDLIAQRQAVDLAEQVMELRLASGKFPSPDAMKTLSRNKTGAFVSSAVETKY